MFQKKIIAPNATLYLTKSIIVMGCQHSSSAALTELNANSIRSGSRRNTSLFSANIDFKDENKCDEETCQKKAKAANIIYKHLVETIQNSNQNDEIKNGLGLRSEFVRKTLKNSISCVECPICFEQYSEVHVPCTLPCGHSFCLDHLKHMTTCPICRNPLPTIEHLDRSISLLDASNAISKLTSALLESESARLLLLSPSMPTTNNELNSQHRNQLSVKIDNVKENNCDSSCHDKYKTKTTISYDYTMNHCQIDQQALSWEDTISSDGEPPLLSTESDDSENSSIRAYFTSENDNTNAHDSFDQMVANANPELLYHAIQSPIEPPIHTDTMTSFVRPMPSDKNRIIDENTCPTINKSERRRIERSDDNQQNNILYTSFEPKEASSVLNNRVTCKSDYTVANNGEYDSRYSRRRNNNMNDESKAVSKNKDREVPSFPDESIYIMSNGVRMSIDNLALIHGRIEL